MAKKLWDKGLPIDDKIEAFTIGKDNEWDLRLAPYDVQGSIAHVKMLAKVGLLSQQECGLDEEAEAIGAQSAAKRELALAATLS